MMAEASLEHGLASLNADFRLSLADRIARIERCWARFQDHATVPARASPPQVSRSGSRADVPGAGHDTEACAGVARDLHTALHSLAGCAPMFGCEMLGQAARRAERMVGRGQPRLTADLPVAMEQMLDLMRVHAAEVAVS
jgi:hypothetical protein